MPRTTMPFAVMAAVMAGSSLSAATVSDVTLVQDVHTRTVEVTYSVSDACVVTLDIQTNSAAGWISIGAENLGPHLSGDVNVKVAAGNRKICWQPDRSWSGHKIDGANARAVVTAWDLNDLPDYMVVDLITTNSVFFYTSAAELPGGLGDARYRRSHIAMRRVHAAQRPWRMGGRVGEPGQIYVYYSTYTTNSASETPHEVTLTADYYMSVFEVTQGQYKQVTKGNPSTFPGYEDSWARPVENISWNTLRGAHWPDNVNPSASSFFGKLRTHANIVDSFDLPTEAQWEYACRAGTGAGLNDGRDLGTTLDGNWFRKATELDRLAWSQNNATSDTVDNVAQTHPVGLKPANAWGFYDMHGNVAEFCLDIYRATMPADSVIDPIGPALVDTEYASGSREYVNRGGSYAGYAHASRCASRTKYNCTWPASSLGFRLCCKAEIK